MKASLKRLSVVTLGLLVLLLALSPVSSIVAQGLGHAFYGTVKIDGGDVAVGTVISARVDGTEYGSSTVTTPGQYALLVQGNIDEGAPIHFYVDGQETDQTSSFHDGWTTELDLTVTTGLPVPKYALTITADPGVGGAATDETGGSPYAAGAEVSIKAVANPGYGFVGWTAPAGDFDDETAEETTFTMPAQAVTVTAHFGVTYELTMVADPPAGGDAIDVDAEGAYAAGAAVSITAEPAAGYGFVDWTADPTVTFDDETAEETTFTMPAQAVTVTAHFEDVSPPEVPTVTTQAATDISSYQGFANMIYTVGDFSPVEVRFACKRPTDPAWFYTTWVSRTADGTYTEPLTGLISETEYEFKAQLKYNGTVIEGATYRLTTARGAGIALGDLSGYLGCFIATAAYGTPTAEQIDVLREFRDVVLLESTVGSQFVVLYYRLSPPIADFIARSDLLRTLVRELLVDPIVWIVEATGDMWRN